MTPCIAYLTVQHQNEAETIASHLIKKRIVACVNIIPNVTSCYIWNEKMVKDNEVIIIAKTIKEKFGLLKDEVIKLHSYENPCIVMIPIEKGQENYISWLINSCS